MFNRVLAAIRHNLVAWLALFVALGGTSLAAKHYLVNSTKQINPKVLQALRGNRGATGPAGLQGREGPAGKGAEGAAGNVGATGKEGPTGKEGAPGATKIVTRYGPNIALKTNSATNSYAACIPGEAITGGGFELGGRPSNTSYYLTQDRPSIEVPGQSLATYPPPENGHAAAGWVVGMENDTGFTFEFQAYVQCASP
jgi:hypothetical protein